MNCNYHSTNESVVHCKGCSKPLCIDCIDPEYKDFCFSCSLDVRNGVKPLKLKSKRQFNERGTKLFIGWYEIFGGLVGITVACGIGLRLGFFYNYTNTILISIILALYILSILSGILLIMNNRLGFQLSIVVQFIQIPQFIIKGTAFSFIAFIAGMQLGLQFYKVIETGIKLNIGIFSEFNLYINSSIIGFMLSVNVVPVVLIYLLFKTRNIINRNLGH